MMKWCIEILIVCCFIAIARGDDGAYKLEGRMLIPHSHPKELRSIRIQLTGTKGETFLGIPSLSGDFAFDEVSEGSYLLEVFSTQFIFDSIRLDIKSSKVRARRANDTTISVVYPLELKPIDKAQYFQERVPYNFASMFKNPMFLMVGVTMFISVLMPKMMANMDPEALKEMQGGAANAPAVVQSLPSWKPPMLTNSD